MLLSRSTREICVLLMLISSVLSQYYNPDYRVSEDLENVDQAGYRGGSSTAESSEIDDEHRPDYSKYYSKDEASSPLIDGASSGFLNDGKANEHGFVTPLDFSGFFGSAQFGAATNQQQSLPVIPVQSPFNFQDALKKQNSSGFVDAGEFNSNFNNAPNFDLDIGKHFSENPFEPKTDNTYVAPKKETYKTPPTYKSEADDLNNYKKYNSKDYEKNLDYTKPKTDYIAPVNTYNYPPIAIVPTSSSYPGGKINHLSTVKTYVPQLYPATKLPNTPYQKYNFQPTVALPIKSTLPPLNSYNLPSTANTYYSGTNDFTPTEFAQPSEYKPQKVQNSNCQKVAKNVSPDDISHGRFRRQADNMNCFLCKDPKSGGTYEQCSYTSDPEDDKSYFRGHAEKYSTKTYSDPEEHSRNRRDTKKDKRSKRKRNDDKEEIEYENPFDYEKKNSHKFNSKPHEFDETSYYKSPDFSHYEKDTENYRFGPEYFSGAATEEKSYSELQSEELKKGENCKQIKKDSMTCMICSNPKTGGNYEQCSYTSEPKEKKYAYVKEKKYNSNDPDPEEKTVESTENKPTIQRNKSRYQPKTVEFSASTKHPKQLSEKDDYYIPHHFITDTKQKQKRYQPTEREEAEEEEENKNKHGDYVYKLFPEYAEKESKNREVKQRPSFEYKSDLPEYFTAEESKKDVDSVLQEFSKKDRSKCKKIAKDKMTCYVCSDAKGVQHEECMFVSESQPKSSHIAYHEVKEFSSDPKKQNGDEETADSQPPKIKALPENKRKSKKGNAAKITLVDAEPTEYVKVTGKAPRIVRRKTNISKDIIKAQESKRDEIKVRRPQREAKEENTDKEEHFEIPEGPEGAFASELVPVFSKKLGVTLPKFMVEISDDEKVFDEVVKAG